MSRASRVVIDASAARTGGGPSIARELSLSLASLAPELECIFVVSRAFARTPHALSPSHRMVLVPKPFDSVAGRVFWQQTFLPRALRAFAPHWVLSPFNVAPTGPGLPTTTRRAVVVYNIGPFSPEIASASRGYQAMRNRLLRLLTLRSLAVADHVFLLSRDAKELLGSELTAKRVTLLPVAPPPPELIHRAQHLTLPASVPYPPFYVCLGNLYPYKGFEDAIRAVGTLRADGVEIRLIVAGNPLDSGYARWIAQLARTVGRTGVTFLRGISQTEAMALMAGSIATVMCSRAENTSRVPVEAMALGSPLVAADIPNARETAGDGAVYYPVGDWNRLAAVMRELLEDEAARLALAARGTAHISRFDWMSATRAILEALELM
jgi:glycosyltransferase involved in cell wall biosynthesis